MCSTHRLHASMSTAVLTVDELFGSTLAVDQRPPAIYPVLSNSRFVRNASQAPQFWYGCSTARAMATSHQNRGAPSGAAAFCFHFLSLTRSVVRPVIRPSPAKELRLASQCPYASYSPRVKVFFAFESVRQGCAEQRTQRQSSSASKVHNNRTALALLHAFVG